MRMVLLVSVIFTAIGVSAADPGTGTQPAGKVLPRSETMFGIHFDLHPSPGDPALGADVTEEMVGRVLDRVKPDFVQYDCKGHAGWLGYPSEVGPSAPHIVNDSLAVWRKMTRQRGVGLYIHFSGLFDIHACQEHPEWAAVGADGKPSTQATSVFAPYVTQRMIPQLTEAVRKYDLDGVWADGECWAAAMDYSPAALEAWKQETGYGEAPRKRGEPHWLEWKEFQRRAFERYVAKWVDAVHEVKPGLQVTSNWLYSTFVPRPVTVNLDFLSGDYDPSMSVDKARIEARYFASTGRTWDLIAWGFLHGHNGFAFNHKPAAHLQQEAGVVLMQGGGIHLYYQPTRSGHITDMIIETAGQVGDFCRARREICHQSRSVPQVAVMLSTAAMLDRSDAVGSTGGTYNEMIGALHAMLESHYSADILAEHQIKGRLAEYPLIVLPDFDQFDPQFLAQLPGYVENGGRLLVLGANAAKLVQPLLGVKLEGQPQPLQAELLTSGGLANVNGPWQNVTLAGAEAAGYRYPIRDTRKDGQIAATINRHGKGVVGAIYGPLGVYFLNQHHPYVRRFIGDLAAKIWPEPAFTFDGPACVDLSLRRAKDGRLCLHMLNRLNMPTSPNYELIDYVPPIGPVKVTMRMAAAPKDVRLLPGNEELQHSFNDGVLTVSVPRIGIHEVLAVKE